MCCSLHSLFFYHVFTSQLNLSGNHLCGVDAWGQGTYTTEGITKLCEGLKGSAVTSLKCAAAQ